MTVMDAVNKRHGKNSIYIAAEGVHKKWAMRQATTPLLIPVNGRNCLKYYVKN